MHLHSPQIPKFDELSARILLANHTSPANERVGALVAEFGPIEALAKLIEGIGTRSHFLGMINSDLVQDLESVIRKTKRAQAQIIFPGSQFWPKKLNELDFQTPLCLWVRGDLEVLINSNKQIAVVGARAASQYGEQVAGEIGSTLARSDAVTISGAAFGIDAAAHRGAIAGGGKTIAVLGCGIDVAYPAAHAGLISRIVETGAVVSEIPPTGRPLKQNFLTRNRIIAALSDEVVVVEAAQRSGSLSTANWANALGRKVWGVPGPINSATSRGTNQGIANQSMNILADLRDLNS
ncbi:MAG: DNA-protecting protein DprA [Actinomycetota bacterium]|jgi:DNA processing protein